MNRRIAFWLVGVLVALVPLGLVAQRRGFFGFGRRSTAVAPNQVYDGRFTFVRIRYSSERRWYFDYPDMDQNLSTMLDALTSMKPHLDGTNVFDLDDPELFRYPVAYLTEPGYWVPSESEVLGLRTYLAKGGFLIVDDFFDPGNHFGPEWTTFNRAIHRVLPSARIEPLTLSHPIFHCFFNIPSLHIPYPGQWGQRGLYGEFYGIFEDNNPDKRLQVVIDYNMDIGDYMEWSATGLYLVDPTNEAYKFGINYVVYGLTH